MAQDRETATSGAIIWSQQDFEAAWEQEYWPVTDDGFIECLNPDCNSPGFERTKLVSAVSDAMDSGDFVAGAIRCEGIDRANVTPCTNALLYLMEDE